MEAELDIFSGRPNPVWLLDANIATQIREMLAALPRLNFTPPPHEPGLGYRGFRLRDDDGTTYRVYHQHIEATSTMLADPTSRIEHLLIDHMPPELDTLRTQLFGTR